MIGLPHLMVLQYIKRQMRYIRANPQFIEHALSGYNLNTDVRSIFGAKRIDGGIKWFQQNEFNYIPLYNMDVAKFPSICVSYESLDEGIQFLGDHGGFENDVVNLPAKTYVSNFTLKGITDERNRIDLLSTPVVPQYGFPIVSGVLKITDSIWRGLILTDGVQNYKITDFRLASNGFDTVIVTDSLFPLNKWSGKWNVISSNNTQGYELLSSMDKTRIKVELGISSDPETAEMVGCVLKYVLKSGRQWLLNNNFMNPVFSQSSLMMFPNQQDNPTWSIQFTITGVAQDIWYGSPIQKLDYIDLSVDTVESLDIDVTVASESGGIGYEIEESLKMPVIKKQTPKMLYGVAMAIRNASYTTDLNNFEAYVNTDHELQLYFSTFDTRSSSPDMITPYFYTYPLSMWNNGKIPVLTWYPATSNVYPTPADICIQITNGVFDSYINSVYTKISQFLTDAKPSQKLGLPKIYMRFAHEMNMSTHVYSGPTPQDFINMWRYVYNMAKNFPKLTPDTMQWVWCPSEVDINTPPFEEYYPGDDFVDWLALDGYAWRGQGPQYTLEQVFSHPLDRIKAINPNKPVMLAEYGVSPKVGFRYDIKGKADWVRNGFTSLTSSWIEKYNVKAAMYYNITLNTTDIDSGIFIHSSTVVDLNSLDTWYTAPDGNRYFTFSTIQNDYGKRWQIGFKNAGVQIDTKVFKGIFSSK